MCRCRACNGQGVRLVQQQVWAGGSWLVAGGGGGGDEAGGQMAPGFNVQMQQQCEKCGGRGFVYQTKCPNCGGNKVHGSLRARSPTWTIFFGTGGARGEDSDRHH